MTKEGADGMALKQTFVESVPEIVEVLSQAAVKVNTIPGFRVDLSVTYLGLEVRVAKRIQDELRQGKNLIAWTQLMKANDGVAFIENTAKDLVRGIAGR